MKERFTKFNLIEVAVHITIALLIFTNLANW